MSITWYMVFAKDFITYVINKIEIKLIKLEFHSQYVLVSQFFIVEFSKIRLLSNFLFS